MTKEVKCLDIIMAIEHMSHPTKDIVLGAISTQLRKEGKL